jgi:hypothetical protein
MVTDDVFITHVACTNGTYHVEWRRLLLLLLLVLLLELLLALLMVLLLL